ncbi:MAG: hypothetical protein ACLPSW_17145 [Roseiarcus sp.]
MGGQQPQPKSLIHHSDRGVQYACSDHVERLEARKIAIIMSRPGNPCDNAKAYANIEDARRRIGAFIDAICNRQRLHSAQGYRPPVEFEAELRPVTPTLNQDEALTLSWRVSTEGCSPRHRHLLSAATTFGNKAAAKL